MSFTLVFDRTGDEICFDPINQEVLEFYIEQLNYQSLNNFISEFPNRGQHLLDMLTGIRSTIIGVNHWLYDLFDIKFDECDIEGYLDQKNLNKAHADWVCSHNLVYHIQEKRKQFGFAGTAEKIHDLFPDDIQMPPLGVVLDQLGLSNTYSSINRQVHTIEDFFTDLRYATGNTWTKLCDNPFSKNILSNNIANIHIPFHHLGRTRYNKFIFFDKHLEYDDENMHNELLGFVSLRLLPTQTIQPSPEYMSWCKTHGKQPVGDFLNIGNIPNLYDNLTKYRIIIFRNLLKNNSFSIHKVKG